jgi:hypothetical protein
MNQSRIRMKAKGREGGEVKGDVKKCNPLRTTYMSICVYLYSVSYVCECASCELQVSATGLTWNTTNSRRTKIQGPWNVEDKPTKEVSTRLLARKRRYQKTKAI